MSAAALVETSDPFAAMRALNKMRVAGFALRLEAGDLIVAPFSQLSEKQRAFIRAHKAALVALLMDAEIVYRALEQAGPAGLGWMEGTPADWSDAHLLAAGEMLYADGRMVNRADRRFLREHAPPIPDTVPDCVPRPLPALANVIPSDTAHRQRRPTKAPMAAGAGFDDDLPDCFS